MLSFYGSFKVPGVPYVTIYRDDEQAHKFYMVPERPTIARDEDGDPLFTFLLYARDVDRLPADQLEAQRGYLALSTQVAVSPADEQKIRDYLRGMLNGEHQRGFRFLRLMLMQVEPELGYPPEFIKGSVEFRTFGEEMAPFTAGSKVPSLTGTNIASFSQSLTQDGSELFRQAIVKAIVPAVITYSLTFLARIPALSIRIRGDRAAFYQELKEKLTQTQVSTVDLGIITYTTIQTWETMTLAEFRSTFHSLTIEIDDRDFREGGGADDITQKVEEMAFKILENQILPSFFENAFPAKPDDPKTDQWLSTRKQVSGQIDVRLTRSDVVEVTVNPNAQLSQVLTPDEIQKHTAYVDLSQPYFQELDVKVSANVNFASDPIYALKVFLDYDQHDDLRDVQVKKAKEFKFTSGDQVQRLRQIMAKGRDSAPKDAYRYWSTLVYKDTGETIRVPSQGALESRERELVISYRQLGFVKVNLAMAAMPDKVRAAQVRMRYPGYQAPSADQSFELTREKPTATYFTYTGGTAAPGPYRYRISYVLTDGQRIDDAEQDGRAQSLVIPDPFEQTITTRFLAQGDFNVVQKIIVDALYQDRPNDFTADHHAELAGNGETSAWAIGVRDPNARTFEYGQTIVYRNGGKEDLPKQTGTLGTTITVGKGAVDALDITVTSLVDWAKYQLVLVYLEYADAANAVHESKNFTLRRGSDGDQTWRVLLRDKAQRAYRYRVRLMGLDGANNREVDWTTTTDPILVVQ